MIAAPLTLLLAKITLLLVLALVLDALLRRRAALALSGVWNAVLLVLVLFPMASFLAPHWSWELPPEAALAEAVPIRSPAPEMVNESPEASPQNTPVSERPAPSTGLPVAPGTLPRPFLSASTLSWTLTVAYCLGAGLLLARLLAAWLAVRALRRDAVTIATGIWADGLRDTQAAPALALPVRLVQSDRVRVPSALGIWDRVIAIPPWLTVTTDRGLVHAVLTHELAHMTRGDLPWQLLQRLVEAMLWFHPLVWLASRRIAFIRERACDEFVVHALGDANAYAQTLVELASGAGRRQMLVCGLAVVRSSNLERRLNALLNSKGDSRLRMARPIRWSLAGASCLVALVLGCVEVTRAGAGKRVLDSAQEVPRIWREWAHLRNHNNLVYGVAYAPSGEAFATAGAGGTIRIWDAATLKEKTVLRKNWDAWTVCFSPDGRTVASGGGLGQVCLWDMATGLVRTYIDVDRQSAVSLAFSPDGKTIAMGGGTGTLSCWDVETGKNIGPGFAKGIQIASGGLSPAAVSVAFSPDGKLLAAGLFDRTVWLWDLRSGNLTILEGHTGPVFSVAFTPDGKLLVSGAGHGDGSIKIWDVAAKKEIGRCEAGGGEVHSLAVAPDGRTVAAGARRSDSKKPQVELWDLMSRKRTLILGSTRESVGALAFSPSGEVLAATSGNLYFGFRSGDETEADWRARGEVVLWHRVKAESKAPIESAPKASFTQEKQGDSSGTPKEKDDPKIRYQTFTVTGRAVDAGGKPVAGATIFLVSTNNSPNRLLGKTTTNTEGRYAFRDAQLPYPVNERDDVWEQGTFQVFGKSPGHAFSWAGMKYLYIDPRFADRKDPPSTESFFPTDRIEIRLEFGPRKKIDGRIVNEKGEPIAGVKVRMGNCDYVDKASREKHQNFREFWAIEQAAAVLSEQVATATDDQGRFQFASVPPEVICWLRLEHPDYAHMSLYTTTAENPPALHDDHPVLKLPLQLTLAEVRTIMVQVRSENGDRPMAGYRIFGNQQRASGSSSNGTSDKDGRVILKLPQGEYKLVSDPPLGSDHIRTVQALTVNNTAATQSIVLRQHVGCVLILKAVDAVTGQSIPKVKFMYEFQRNSRTSVQSNTAIIDNPHTNVQGELRAVVVPGQRRYWATGPFPAGYELDDRDDLQGRELELPAGKTVTATFKLRLKQ